MSIIAKYTAKLQDIKLVFGPLSIAGCFYLHYYLTQKAVFYITKEDHPWLEWPTKERRIMEKRGVILVPIGVALVLFVGGVAAQPSAVATIMDAEGVAVGEATFTLGPNRSVHVEVTVSGVSSGEHAVHIHTVGLCEGPTFESAGPHFNPHNRKHGRANPEGSHAGDLPNVRVGADGKGQIKVTVTGITLDGLGKESLFKEGGTSLVLHANKDDNMTDPTGNAGPRIACGVIKPFPPVGKATKR